jgi:phage N-6-adenine-methyltransferase
VSRPPRRCGNLGCSATLTAATTGRPRRYCSDACRVAAWRKRHRRSVHFSSRKDEWATPRDVFTELDAEFGFDLDPCATPENAKCERFYTREQDGLAQPWLGHVFMNPPYGRDIGRWMEKAWRAAQETADVVVCLVPARTDTAWGHNYVARGEVRFLRGRLRFGDASTGAPFPSAVVVFRNAAAVTKSHLRAVA